MIAKLFDIQNGKVVPTEHCYTLKSLKDIMDNYPEDHLKIYQYLFYMTCPNPDMNPFFHTPEHEKEEVIMKEVEGEFSTEDDDVWAALKFCEKMYQTPTSRAYKGIAAMLDRLGKYQQIRESFKGAYKDLQEEQQSTVRGGIGLGYDQ